MDKKKIAVFIDWFLPGYKAGGPITSVANLIENLKDFFDFYVITSDRDIGDKNAYVNVPINQWIKTDNYQIIYLSPEKQKKDFFKEIFTEKKFDIIYFNSLFSLRFTLLPLKIVKKYTDKKIILAPRGMLGEGALSIKPTKKIIFLYIAKLLKLYNDVGWHATNEMEKNDIVRFFGKQQKIIIAENLINKPEYTPKHKILKEIKIVFISRISPKKNLDFALRILKDIEARRKVSFDIIGPIEDVDYWRYCQSIINNFTGNIRVSYLPAVKHNEIFSTLERYNFLFLPTKHENFGHSIFEALSTGTPVIISNNTPWQNLQEKKVGWDIDLQDTEKFKEVINYVVNMSQQEYDDLSKNAFKFAQNFFENSNLIEKSKKLFQ